VIVDDDDPAALSVVAVEVIEGNAGARKLRFMVELDAPSGKPVTVEYATSDAAATTPGDFMHASGQLTFAPG
jgi:hypothetical protein